MRSKIPWFKSKLLFYVLFSFLLLVGASIIYMGFSQKNIISDTNYIFRLGVTPKTLNIANFKFKYYFTEKAGMIKFGTSQGKIESLSFHFPVSVNPVGVNKNFNLDVYERKDKNQLRNLEISYNNNCSEKKKNSYCIEEEGKLLMINGLGIEGGDYIFNITHNLKLEPHASFELHTYKNYVGEDDFAFDLFLGNDYRCLSPFYEDIGNSTKKRSSSSCSHFEIEFQDETGNKSQHRFRIFAESLKEERFRDILLVIGTIIVSAVVNLIIQFYFTNQNIKNQEKMVASIRRSIKYYSERKKPKKEQ